MKKVYLHVGFHKTASSSIQATLGNNRKYLFELGYIYPDFDFENKKINNHSISLPSMFRDNPENFRFNIRFNYINKIKKLHESYFECLNSALLSDKDVILSAEELSTEKKSDLLKLKEYLLSFNREIVVIAYVRNPYSFSCSALQEKIKSGNDSLKNIRVRDKSSDVIKLNECFESIKYFSFEKLIKDGFSVVEYFLSLLEISESKIKNFSLLNTNEGFGNLTTRLYSKINERYPEIVNGKLNPARKNLKKINLDNEKFLFTKDELEYLIRDLESENEKFSTLLGDEFTDKNFATSSPLTISSTNYAYEIYKKLKTNYRINILILEFIDENSNFDLDEMISASNNDIDLHRDLAIYFELSHPLKAKEYINIAFKSRPDGKLIQKIKERLN